MRARAVGWWALWMVILLVLDRRTVSAAQSTGADASSLAAEEREGCRRNLKIIYDAIQAYQFDHKELPNWLSDLVPDYISDGNALICPVCRRTGRTEKPPLADPKLACSYLFEFSPVPLVTGAGPGEPRPTRRDWKRRQMGLVGSVVPIVRCRHHDPLLNLAFNGTLYDSPREWELVFTNRIRASELTVDAIFGQSGAEEPTPSPISTAPERTTSRPAVKNQMVDLSPFYTSELTQPLQGRLGDDLSSLPKGTCTLNGIGFDIRGLIQVGADSGQSKLPPEVKGIPIHQRCQHLYFLHAACVAGAIATGEQIGAYRVHLSKSDTLLEIPIYFGQSVADWHGAKPSHAEKELKVAWIGDNGLSTQTGDHVRLFLTSWNLSPGVDVDTLDFVSTGKQASPFVVAISFD